MDLNGLEMPGTDPVSARQLGVYPPPSVFL